MLSVALRGNKHRTHTLHTDRHTHKHVRGRGFPGRRLIVGVCRLGRGTEQTSALCDSTEQQLLQAAHSFLPANGGTGVLFWTSCLGLIFSPHIMHPRYLSAFVFKGLLNCGAERRLYSFMGREEGVTGSLFVWKKLCIMSMRTLVSPWFRTSVLCPDTVCSDCSSSELVVLAWHQSVSPKSTTNLLLFCSQSTKIKLMYLWAESSTSPAFTIFFIIR